MTNGKWEKLTLLIIGALVLAADQVSKYLVMTNLTIGESWAPIPALERWFVFHYATNTGAAFGLFPELGLFFAIIAAVVAVIIVLYYRYLPQGQWLVRISLGLQLGGALGNLLDRVQHGHVIDFLDFRVWPVFNVADSAIVAGVTILAFCLLREDWQEQKQLRAENAEGKNEKKSSLSLSD
ncbi:MAG: signal peptidase II [Chloroflexota bacterium]|nr:signal peptidase II [Chloroflexota bacterium]